MTPTRSLAIAAMAAALALTGCSSTTETPGDATPVASGAEEDREAAGLYLDTRVCIVNQAPSDTSDPMSTDTSIRWTTYDSVTSGVSEMTLRPGRSTCAVGSFVSGWDVEGTIWPAGGGLARFHFRNNAFSTPEGQLDNLAENTGEFDMPDGFSQRFDLYCASLEVARKADTEYKEIEITVLAPTNCTPEPEEE